MTEIQELVEWVEAEVPGVDIQLDPPADSPSTQARWLDIDYGQVEMTVEWRPDQGFGVSVLADPQGCEAHGLFEGPDKVFDSLDQAKRHIVGLLLKSSQTLSQTA